jgi:hypothetical protein
MLLVDDLKENTEYSGYSMASPVIQWFWEIIQGLSKEDKARFLQFVTGTSKVLPGTVLDCLSWGLTQVIKLQFQLTPKCLISRYISIHRPV